MNLHHAYAELVKERDQERDRAEARVAELERLAAVREDDDRRAAGELLIEVPAPGTDLARVMIANRLLRAEVERLRSAKCVHDRADAWLRGSTEE